MTKFFVQAIQRSKLQLRWKLLGGFLAANLLLGLALGVAVFTLGNTTSSFTSVADSHDRELLVNQILLYQERLISTALDSALTGKIGRQLEFDNLSASLSNALANFKPQPWQQDDYNNLKTELDKLKTILRGILQDGTTGSQNNQAALQVWNRDGIKEVDRIRSLTDNLIQKERANVAVERERAINQVTDSAVVIGIFSMLALLVAIGLAFLLTAALTQPLNRLKHSLKSLADGDLTRQAEIANRDELGELGEIFNTTLISLAALIKNLYLQSQKVNQATSELTRQANNQVAGSMQQAGSIAEATRAIEQLNQTASEIAQQALEAGAAVERCLAQSDRVNRLAEDMTQSHQRGRAIIARTIEGLHSLQSRMAGIQEQQQLLLNQSANIQRVINLISGIAQSTHLLSLNAAIEAAGAGEYGERFAVVAHEIKELSDKAVWATKEIRDSLGGIAASVEEANNLGTQCLTEAEQVVGESRDSDRVLLELAELSQQTRLATAAILQEIKGTVEMTSHIGVSTSQQRNASSQMLEKMLSIDVVTSQNLNSIKYGEAATRELSFSAQELERFANTFKLDTAPDEYSAQTLANV